MTAGAMTAGDAGLIDGLLAHFAAGKPSTYPG